MSHEIKRAFSSVANYYNQFMEETGHTQAQRAVGRLISGGDNTSRLILDVATGTGVMLEAFEDGVGIDISAEMVKQAKRAQPNKDFLVADVHRLPFRSHTFDIAISCLALLWFDNPEQALAEMLRVARHVYIVEEEGIPTRHRLSVPQHLEEFFQTIKRLEKEVNIVELKACARSEIHEREYEADIDGSHRLVCWRIGKKHPY